MTYFKPVWCRQIKPGAENEMFLLSRKQLNFSRKKLRSNCTLTKAYLYAKEQRILVFLTLPCNVWLKLCIIQNEFDRNVFIAFLDSKIFLQERQKTCGEIHKAGPRIKEKKANKAKSAWNASAKRARLARWKKSKKRLICYATFKVSHREQLIFFLAAARLIVNRFQF